MRVYQIKVNGKKYKVEVASITEVTPTPVETKEVKVAAQSKVEETKAAPVVAKNDNGVGVNVVAPMQGQILNVLVNVGSEVKAGDNLAILEAMKLENEIKAPVAGKVVAVKVSKGQNVNAQDVLIVIG